MTGSQRWTNTGNHHEERAKNPRSEAKWQDSRKQDDARIEASFFMKIKINRHGEDEIRERGKGACVFQKALHIIRVNSSSPV